MDIVEVAEILSAYRLPKPQHILIVKEPVYERVDGILFYRGLAPAGRSDVIVLTPDALPETVLHETLHNLGFGELVASLGGKILIRKYQFLKKHPILKELATRKVIYRKCEGCSEFRLVHSKYAGRVLHYVRVK